MAPEQIEGGDVDHRCDQFGFCVALYEALYGERPCAGANLPELRGNVRGGRIAPVPAGARVPAWLRRVLLRGLTPRREHRYPTPDALRAALPSDPPARRRRRTTIAAAVLAGVGLVAFGWYREHSRGGLSQGAGDRLAAVWGDEQRQALAASVAATGVSYADAARRGVAVRLLVPGDYNDSRFVRRVSRIFYRPMLDAGVRIFEYRPTMMHAKAISADDDWAVIGSANFDNRSFELNYESNLVVVDGGLTKALRAAFERDLERAEEITADRLDGEAAWKTWLGRLLVVVRDQL
jgi:hypothetical protein